MGQSATRVLQCLSQHFQLHPRGSGSAVASTLAHGAARGSCTQGIFQMLYSPSVVLPTGSPAQWMLLSNQHSRAFQGTTQLYLPLTCFSQILYEKNCTYQAVNKKVIGSYIHLNQDNTIRNFNIQLKVQNLLGCKEYAEFDMFSKLKFFIIKVIIWCCFVFPNECIL